MLEYRRYRDAAAHLSGLFADGRRYLYRSAPLPPELRRVALEAARPAYEPDLLAASIGDLLRTPPRARHQPHPPDRLARAPAAGAARAARRARPARLRRSFGEEDRLTQAVTLFALLELHKRGEATWEQGETFGAIENARHLLSINARHSSASLPGAPGSREGVVSWLERTVEALLFLSPEPVTTAELAEACEASEAEIDRALDLLATALAEGAGRRPARGRRRPHARRRSRCRGGRAPAAREAEDPAADPGAGGDARDRRLPAAGLAPRDRPYPRRRLRVRGPDADRARPDRGVGALAVRRCDLPHHAAVRAPLRPRRPRPAARPRELRPDARGRARAARAPAARRRAARAS